MEQVEVVRMVILKMNTTMKCRRGSPKFSTSLYYFSFINIGEAYSVMK